MARSVSGTLEAAQSATSRKPYIHLLLTHKDGSPTYDFSSDSATYGNRILLIDHSEAAYSDSAVIILKNYPRDIPTMKGYWVDIGYGDVTGGGNEYSETSRLWVKHQQTISIAGNLLVILELTGKWARLDETLLRIGDPPLYMASNEDGDFGGAAATIYTVIEYIIENEVLPAMTLAALVEDDGIINDSSFKPVFSVNTNRFDSAAWALYTLIKMTLSYLKPLAGLDWEIKYPQATDDVDFTYYSDQSPKFYEYAERDNLLIPNRIIVFANAGGDELWTDMITVEVTDPASLAVYPDTYDIVLAPELTTGAQAYIRANAVLSRYLAEAMGGRLVIPHDCRVELYDRVEVEDSRGI